MKAAIGCLIGLVFGISASAEPLLEGRVRLESGQPVADAQVRIFDLNDLERGAIARAMTDGTGYFSLPFAALTGQALPARFALGPNYPNPFNPSTNIPYQLAASSAVRLEVFNLLGQRIATLVDGERPAGFHTATWHATDAAGRAVAAGVYIYRMTVGVESQTGRMVLLDGQAGVPAAGVASVLSGVSGGGSDGAESEVYGLIVSGEGLAPYVDSSFRVEAGMVPVELVVSSGHSGGKAADDDCAFCDLLDGLHDEAEGPGPSGKAQATLEAPPAPTNLRFDAPTDSSCTVHWDASDGATDYDVNYRPAVGGQWTNEPHRGIRLYNTIHDLEPGTEYRWAVRAENGEGRSAWVFGPNFTTLEEETDETTAEEAADGQAPAAPTNLRFDAPTDSSCRVRWAAAAGATDYDVNYKPAVGGRWTNEPHRGTGLSNTIHDLEPGTEYRWAVRAENGEGRSAWVFGPNFTTVDSGGGSSDDHSNTRSGATSLALGSSLAGEIETGRDVDYFSVQISESGTLTIYTTGSLDTKGRLESSSGSILASNDDGGRGSNFRIERSVSAGTYYVRVESYSSRTGSYTLHASFESSSSGDDDDGGDGESGDSGTTYGAGETLPNYPSGFFVPRILSGASLSSSSGRTILSFNNGGFVELLDGTRYTCIASGGCSIEGGRVTSGTIRVTTGDGGDDDGGSGGSSDDHSNTRSGATSLALGSSLAGEIETGRDVDYFSVQISESGTLTIYTTGSLDTKGRLESSSGSTLASNDDGGRGSNFRIERSVSAGTYYVRVESYSSRTGSYTLHASFESSSSGDDDDGGDGESGSDGDVISLSITNCSGSYWFGNSGAANIYISGTVYAHRSVSSVRLTGYANGSWVGVDFINGLSAGESENFGMSGIISTSGSSLDCSVSWEATFFASAKVTAGDAESSEQVRVQGSLSTESALINRKRSLEQP